MFTPLIRFSQTFFASNSPRPDASKSDNVPLEIPATSTFTPSDKNPTPNQASVVLRGVFRPDTVQLANQVLTEPPASSSPFDATAAARELFEKSASELGHSDNLRSFFNQLLRSRETPVIMRLMSSALMIEIFQNRHRYPTIDSVVDVIEKRHGEVSLGFFGKTKLLFAVQPFLGKKDFFVHLIKLIATRIGLPEGVVMLELLNFSFKMGPMHPEIKDLLENFLKLLKVEF